MVAAANIAGTEQKQLLAKSTVSAYTVCNSGHHDVTMTHDENDATVSPGDCVAVEAKTITASGTDDDARNMVSVHNHN